MKRARTWRRVGESRTLDADPLPRRRRRLREATSTTPSGVKDARAIDGPGARSRPTEADNQDVTRRSESDTRRPRLPRLLGIQPLVVAALVLVSALLVAVSSGARPETARPDVGRTIVSRVDPVEAPGILAPGYVVSRSVQGDCVEGSLVIPNPTFVRCFTGHVGFDPCWPLVSQAPHASAVCLRAAWQRRVIEIQTRASLPPITSTDRLFLAGPWGVELTRGQRCGASGSIPFRFKRKAVEYYCDPSKLRLLNYPDRRFPLWRFESVLQRGAPGHYAPAGTVKVRRAWYASP
jgi:hypothetical protein